VSILTASLNNQHMSTCVWDNYCNRRWEDSVKINILRKREHRSQSIKYILIQYWYIPSKHETLERATKVKSRLWE
jgi:hypothetical protein